MLKTHGCGELRGEHAGQAVVLAGWVHRRRDHGGLVFVDLRDASGLVQVVFHPESAPEATALAGDIRHEFVIQVHGTVAARQSGTENADLPTGAIEVQVVSAAVLNASATPPFPVNEDSEVGEATRLRYRYIDLRRAHMAANLRLRHAVVKYIRDFLSERGFLEVETPTLGLATPEGARDYLVPSRVQPGSFYALPQSPQQLKQLLMVAGVDRYFQIARCYRDEDLRSDRQPEFTQLDLEVAFAEEQDILALTEDLYSGMAAEVAPHYSWPEPFHRLTFADSMERFGTDKPDLRYDLELHDLTDLVRHSEFKVFASAAAEGGRVRGIAVPGGADTPRRRLDRLTELAVEAGAKGLVWIVFEGTGSLSGLTEEDVRSPVARFFSPDVLAALGEACGAARGDLLLIAADRDTVTSRVLDVLRREVASERELADPTRLEFAFVTEFPLYEWDETNERWNAAHHMFTAPAEADLHLIGERPADVGSRAYDFVCNGHEIASGSVRIHSRETQLAVMASLGIGEEDAVLKFGHMLEAFTYGAPPHAGIAPGIDRTVALFAGENDIREVIAFPKTKSASDPMTGAPAPVTAEQLGEVHLELNSTARAAIEARVAGASTDGAREADAADGPD